MIDGVHLAIAIEVVRIVNGGGIHQSGGIGAGANFVDGIDVGVGGGIAGIADGIAEVEDVIRCQTGVEAGERGDLEPLALDGGGVIPGDFNTGGSIDARAGANDDVRWSRRVVPVGR